MKENMEKNIKAGKRSIVAKFRYTIFLYLPVPSKKKAIQNTVSTFSSVSANLSQH